MFKAKQLKGGGHCMKDWYIKSFSKLLYFFSLILVVSFAINILGIGTGIIIALIAVSLK
jgi:hypothetical protein